MSLSTLGGRLVSWEVLTYRDREGRTIQLLPSHPTAGALALDVWGESDRQTVYTSDQSALVLSTLSATGIVRLSGRLPSGLYVTKAIQVAGHAYEATVRVSLFNPFADPVEGRVSLVWERGLSGHEYEDGQATVMVADTARHVRLKKLQTPETYDQRFRWAAYPQPFSLAALYPPLGVAARGSVSADETAVRLGVGYPPRVMAPRSGQEWEWRVYGGPQTYRDLKAPGVLLEHALDYGRVLGMNFSWLGLWLLVGLNQFFAWTQNYGVSIILLTMVIKLLMFWPAHASLKSSKRMQALQPKIEELKVRLKNHPQQLQAETLKLYKAHKVNPLSGCLLMLPQIPIFIALYTILSNAAELQGQPFTAWIQDLSKADPYYILPLLMGGTMFLQQKMTPVADPAQAKIMLIMPVMLTFMFLRLPSGVVLYWTVQNVLSIIHQWWINRQPVTLISPRGLP